MNINDIKIGLNYKKIGNNHAELINIVNIVSNEKLICGNGQVCGGNYAIYYYVFKYGRNFGGIHITNENNISELNETEQNKLQKKVKKVMKEDEKEDEEDKFELKVFKAHYNEED